MNPFDLEDPREVLARQIQQQQQSIAQMQQSQPSQQDYYDAQAAQMKAKNNQQLISAMMPGRKQYGSGAYDGLSALLDAFTKYKGMEKHKAEGESIAESIRKQTAYQDGQKKLEQEQAMLKELMKQKREEDKYQRNRTDEMQDKKDYELWKKDQGISSNPTVNINNSEENAFMKGVGTENSKLYGKWGEQANEAVAIKNRLADLAALQDMAQTGKWQEMGAILGQYVPVGNLKNEAAVYQAYNGMLKGLVPIIKSQFGSLGVMSKDDWKVIFDTMPAFGNDPRANQIIIGLLTKGANTAIKRYEDATAYVNEHNKLRGFVSPMYKNPFESQEYNPDMLNSLFEQSTDALVKKLQ